MISAKQVLAAVVGSLSRNCDHSISRKEYPFLPTNASGTFASLYKKQQQNMAPINMKLAYKFHCHKQ